MWSWYLNLVLWKSTMFTCRTVYLVPTTFILVEV